MDGKAIDDQTENGKNRNQRLKKKRFDLKKFHFQCASMHW